MSNSNDIHEDLSAYLDGELSAERGGQIELALADDAELSAQLNDIRAVRALLSALPCARVGRDFADSVLQQAERTSLVADRPTQADRRPMRWMRYTAAAALLMVAASLGVMLFSELWPADVGPRPFDELARSGDRPAIGEGDSDDATVREDTNGRRTVLTAGNGERAGRGVTDAGGRTDAGGGGTTGPGMGGGAGTTDSRYAGKALAGVVDDRYAKKLNDTFGRRGGAVTLANLPQAEINEIVYTPAVVHTQRRIETFLASNAIRPITTTSTVAVGGTILPRALGRGNHYYTRRVTAEQVRIRIDAATPEQVERIRQEIDRIRVEQRVSQAAIPGEAIALHRADRSDPGRLGKGAPRPAAEPAAVQTADPLAGNGTGAGATGKPLDEAVGRSIADGVEDEHKQRAAARIEHRAAKPKPPVRPEENKPLSGAGISKSGGTARRQGPDRPRQDAPDGKRTRGFGNGQAPPKPALEDHGVRKIEGKGAAAKTGLGGLNVGPGQVVNNGGQVDTVGRNGDFSVAQTGQEGQLQTLEEFLDAMESDKGRKQDGSERGEQDSRRKKGSTPGGWGTGYPASTPASRPARTTSQSARAPKTPAGGKDTTQFRGKDGPRVARQQLQRPASRAAGQTTTVAGANVQALVITLNFRATADAAKTAQAEAPQQAQPGPETNGRN